MHAISCNNNQEFILSQSVYKNLCERTRQRDAGRAGQTASAQGRHTCCSSSQSPGPADPESGHQPADASRSQRSSSPADKTHLL